MEPIKELGSNDVWMGLACERCSLAFLDRNALDSVRLADAELLFCPQCGQHLAAILDSEALPLAQSA